MVVDKKQQLVNIQKNLEKFEKATQYLEDLKSRVPMQAMDSPPSLPIDDKVLYANNLNLNNRGLKLNIASSNLKLNVNRNQNLSPDAAEHYEE